MTALAKAGAPAKFPTDPKRRAMIAKVHIAKSQLGLTDDDYRAVLFRVSGHSSASQMSNAQLQDVIADFERRGFTARAKGGKPRPADHPMARKARAMWISLHHLGVVANPSEHALEAFATRQLGCDRLQWANQGQGFKLVEALKAMAERAGWSQAPDFRGQPVKPIALKRRLVEAIVAHLKEACIIPDDWGVVRAAWDLCGIRLPGIQFAGTEELDLVAKGLGAKLRAAIAPNALHSGDER